MEIDIGRENARQLIGNCIRYAGVVGGAKQRCFDGAGALYGFNRGRLLFFLGQEGIALAHHVKKLVLAVQITQGLQLAVGIGHRLHAATGAQLKNTAGRRCSTQEIERGIVVHIQALQ